MQAHLISWLPSALLAAATYGLCHWWYGRRLDEAMGRMQKLDRTCQAAEHQTLQARRQIEQLQQELAAQHRARAVALSARKRTQIMQDIDRAFERERSTASGANHLPLLPLHGFADTQPM